MKTNTLGNTGINVTELCFGVLPMGPSQLGVDAEEGARIIWRAVDAGVNFVDTAQGYRTYEHVRRALQGHVGQVHLATKSHATTYDEMDQAVIHAFRELRVETIDIFHLHAARSTASVFDERAGALECLCDYRAKGLIKSVGVSTHSVTTVRRAIENPDIDVIFPIINHAGLGILHGTRDEMVGAIADAAAAGKGVYAMKALGGGNLMDDVPGALNYVRALPGVSSVAVGMVSMAELEVNLAVFEGRPVRQTVPRRQKKVLIQTVCKGCGTCVDTCPNYALELVEGKATVDPSRCITCGYCAPVCPLFAIRLV
ncbi:MAG: aldo/keto reductase [Bacillota bacterium]|nr:aldo/keto reductase [Bacillota bacterium]